MYRKQKIIMHRKQCCGFDEYFPEPDPTYQIGLVRIRILSHKIFISNFLCHEKLHLILVNNVFLSFRKTFQHTKGLKYVNFSSLGSGTGSSPKRGIRVRTKRSGSATLIRSTGTKSNVPVFDMKMSKCLKFH
jgi:hypothetical protein